jgi:hypothetical protein
VIAIRNDIDPEVVITWHRSEFNNKRCLDSARHDRDPKSLPAEPVATLQKLNALFRKFGAP